MFSVNFPMKNLLAFEKKILMGLRECKISEKSFSSSFPLGIAVSGGADSVSLLVSLASIFDSSCLRVITLDHGIRVEEESSNDADFVRELCEKFSIRCRLVKIPHGKITSFAETSSQSVEAVARNFRYEAFESFIKDENLCALCLAHNQDDQCETLMMRFLQGSGTEGMGGIERIREKYIRPLLSISRKEIESYLREKNQIWCTDSTNSDTKYFRNRVRNVLVPVLNENFPGWQNAVLSGAKKSSADESFFIQESKSFRTHSVCEKSSVKIDAAYFFNLHPALQRRVFFGALNDAGFGGRFPFKIFEEILSWGDKKSAKVSFENVCVIFDCEKLEIFVTDEKNEVSEAKSCIESGFYFLFKRAGECLSVGGLSFYAGNCFEVQESSGQKISLSAKYPFVVRSALPGDQIKTADGKYKSLSEIFADWKIPENQRNEAVVVEELCSGEKKTLRAVLAFHLGAKNWIVE